MTSYTGSVRGGFAGIWKRSVSWELNSEWEEPTFGAHWGQTNLCATRAARDVGGGADGKNSMERLCLSPYVEKPLNSKLIKKSFVPELRSRKCFCISEFLCFMLCIYVMNILCTFHISVSGYGTLTHIIILYFYVTVDGILL